MFRNKNTGRSFKQDLQQMRKELAEATNTTIPAIVKEKLELIITDSFEKESYQGETSSKWKPRKDDIDGNKRKSQRGAILIASGALRRSIIVEAGNGKVVVGTNSKYAQIHNEGLEGKAFGKHKFKMPKRQFMPIPGEKVSKLDEVMDKEIDKLVNKILK